MKKNSCPDNCPELKIERLSNASGSIAIKSFPATFDPVIPGIELAIGEYDASSGKLLKEHQGRSYGPVLFQDRSLIEIHWSEMQSGKRVNKKTHWIESDTAQNCFRLVLRELKPVDQKYLFEETHLRFPANLDPQFDVFTTDCYFEGPWAACQTFHERFACWARVCIGTSTFECLCIESRFAEENRPVVNTYIDRESGRAILKVIHRITADADTDFEIGWPQNAERCLIDRSLLST